MSELIKREDVQREIQASFDGGAFRWQDGQDLMDRINALPTASSWHRCEDELPEKEGDYLVWTTLYGGHAYTDYYTPKYGWDEYKVIAWMPLPEPPKEDA